MDGACLETPDKVDRGPLVGEGGEGRIYEVQGRPDLVVKVYHAPLSATKAAKMRAMIARRPPAVERYAAWPLRLLKDANGAAGAVVMPRITGGRDIHLLYSPRARRQHFPQADWSFLILTAQNVAAAFANVHAAGCVIGDVNHGSVLVKDDAQVALIDCDSFQIRADGRLYACDVAVPTFTPPELQGRMLSDVERSPDHDAFGLAVLIFHLLFMGRHPFAGRPANTADVPIEQAIREHRFAFSRDRARVRLEPPPHTLPLEAASPEIAALFEHAFGPHGARPTPLDWHGALDRLRGRLQRCALEPAHAFLTTLTACPWCRIETQSGARLFLSLHRGPETALARGDDFGVGLVQGLWRAIMAAPRPVALPLPEHTALAGGREPGSGAQAIGRRALLAARLGYGAAAAAGLTAALAAPDLPVLWAAAGIAGFWTPRVALAPHKSAGVAEILQRLQTAQMHWEAVSARWGQETSAQQFDDVLALLNRLRLEHERLTAQAIAKAQDRARTHQADVQKWTNDRARQAQAIRRRFNLTEPIALTDAELVAAFNTQMGEHLDRHGIEKAGIADIGASRTAKLASFGIETAGDVTLAKVRAVPGFGSSLTRRLISWRRGIEQGFRFDAVRAQADIRAGLIAVKQAPSAPGEARLSQQAERRCRKIESELRDGAPVLQELSRRIAARQAMLLAEARVCAAEYAQAEADARAARLIK